MQDKDRPAQPWVIRLTHWTNIPVLTIMAGSGLQILAAYPQLGPRGAPYGWVPLQGHAPPGWLRLGDWLAGARHWHFALAWVFALNGLLYLLYAFASGEWRRRAFFPKRDARAAVAMMAHYLRLRPEAPPLQFYNGLQRLAYTSALLLAIAEIWSGLVLYKPVQLHWLGVPLGGYDAARVIHLGGLVMLAGFSLGHLLMVLSHPRALGEMITGARHGEPEA